MVTLTNNDKWRENLNEKDVINYHDGDEIWYEVIITKIINEDNKVKNIEIKCKDWSEEDNIIIPIDSDKIAPRYKHILNWKENLEEGNIINVEDDWNIWYEAFIVDIIRDGQIISDLKVMFRGWSEKWNIVLPIDSDKLAPRYKHVYNWLDLLNESDELEIAEDNEYLKKYKWYEGIVIKKNIKEKKLTILKSESKNLKGPLKIFELDIDSPLIAEKYTHTGYVDSIMIENQRNKTLQKQRELAKKKYLEIQKAKYKSNILDDISVYFNNKELSDIKFIFINEEYIYAHKIIICARCEYLKKLFEFNKMTKNEYLIKDISYNIFFEIIKFLYTGEIDINDENCQDILKVSHLYILNDINELAIIFIKEEYVESKSTFKLLNMFNLDIKKKT